jgi:hypothetical protein
MARRMVNVGMRKASAAKPATSVVREEEQLYLVRKSGTGAMTAGGFRHYRRRDKRAESDSYAIADNPAVELTFADNKRGAIGKLLSVNAYYRTHPWPAPFNATRHTLHLGDARDLSWIKDESVHLVVTSPPY